MPPEFASCAVMWTQPRSLESLISTVLACVGWASSRRCVFTLQQCYETGMCQNISQEQDEQCRPSHLTTGTARLLYITVLQQKRKGG